MELGSVAGSGGCQLSVKVPAFVCQNLPAEKANRPLYPCLSSLSLLVANSKLGQRCSVSAER